MNETNLWINILNNGLTSTGSRSMRRVRKMNTIQFFFKGTQEITLALVYLENNTSKGFPRKQL